MAQNPRFRIGFDCRDRNANSVHKSLVVAAPTPDDAVRKLMMSDYDVVHVYSIRSTDEAADHLPISLLITDQDWEAAEAELREAAEEAMRQTQETN